MPGFPFEALSRIMAEQLPLFQHYQDRVSFANYWPGGNEKIVEIIKAQILKPSQPCLYLWGKGGVGKSHLLQAACSYADQQDKSAVYIPLSSRENIEAEILQGLAHYALICIDDLDAIVAQYAWELALFHLFNSAREHGAAMIFAGTKKPQELAINLPDLASRLAWGGVWQVNELRDGEKLAALQLRARQRGFSLPDEVGLYLMQHWPRDMHSLFALLDKLDQASLAEHRKLTIPFVRQFV